MIRDICLTGDEVLVHVDPHDVQTTFSCRDGPLKMLILDVDEAHKLVDGLTVALQDAADGEMGRYERKQEKEL